MATNSTSTNHLVVINNPYKTSRDAATHWCVAVLGGPLANVDGTFSKWNSLTQTFLLLRGRSPRYFFSNSCQKSGCLGTSF